MLFLLVSKHVLQSHLLTRHVFPIQRFAENGNADSGNVGRRRKMRAVVGACILVACGELVVEVGYEYVCEVVRW